LGATLHRYADDAILVCRKDARQALQAFEAIASTTLSIRASGGILY
jgi:hypothetical protein